MMGNFVLMGPLAAQIPKTIRLIILVISYYTVHYCNSIFFSITTRELAVNRDASHCCSLVWYRPLILGVIFLFIHAGICVFLTYWYYQWFTVLWIDARNLHFLSLDSDHLWWHIALVLLCLHQAGEWNLRKLRKGYYCLKWLIKRLSNMPRFDQIEINQNEWKEFVSQSPALTISDKHIESTLEED